MSAEKRDDSEQQAEFDSRFAEIVAQLGPEMDDRPVPNPDEGADEDPSSTAPGSHPDGRTNPTTSWREIRHEDHDPQPKASEGPLAGLPSQWRMPGGDGASFLDDDEEDFVPPPPEPLPKDDVHFWAILATLIGGPLWVLYLAVFDRYAQTLWWVLSLLTCVAGVVLLVMRQPKSHDDPDDDDLLP